jgi:large subunit ribosomal protein L18
MKNQREKSVRRAQRTRTRLRKFANGRLRLSVFRSSKNIYAQIIDDTNGITVAAACSLEDAAKKEHPKGGDVTAAGIVGKMIAERAVKAGVKEVVFDRGGNMFHGRVKALAEAAREGGLSF